MKTTLTCIVALCIASCAFAQAETKTETASKVDPSTPAQKKQPVKESGLPAASEAQIKQAIQPSGAAMSAGDLTVIDPATGLPVGMRDSNGNGIPDLVEANLGLDPSANNSGDPRLQNIRRDYQYDANARLTKAPERSYQMDAEDNIKGQ